MLWSKVLWDKNVSPMLKGRLYRVVGPTLSDGANCWPVKHVQLMKVADLRMRRWYDLRTSYLP